MRSPRLKPSQYLGGLHLRSVILSRRCSKSPVLLAFLAARLQNGPVVHPGARVGTGPSRADDGSVIIFRIPIKMRGILILVQALTAFESASALATGTATPASTFDGVAATCQTDRPDPYVCECLGLNGCWEPSEPGEGPPYMHDGNWPKRSKTCKVKPCNDPNGDDSPEILKAFADCKEDGHIIFEVRTELIGFWS